MIKGTSMLFHSVDMVLTLFVLFYTFKVISTLKTVGGPSSLDSTLNIFRADREFKIPRIFIFAVMVSIGVIFLHLAIGFGPLIYLIFDVDVFTFIRKGPQKTLELSILTNSVRDFIGLFMLSLYLRGVKRMAEREQSVL
jgi:hypothetical protein